MRIGKILKLLIIIACLALLVGSFIVYPKLEVISSYAAKKACSCLNVGSHAQENVERYDLGEFPLSLASLTINKSEKKVSASVFGLHNKTAILRKGIGCALLQGEDDYKVARLSNSETPNHTANSTIKHQAKLERAFELAFDENNSWEKKTFALVVMKDGQVISEKYREGYGPDTKLLGWSMTKSVANLIVGMLIKESRLSLEEDTLFPAWENDSRGKVTLSNLLKMNSGLEWTEQYGSISDITQGLFMEEDFINFARSKPAELEPGKEWEYASGTTNLISGLIKRRFESYQDYLDYPHDKLFSALGLDNPVMETDEAGNYIMSSYMWATARDWGKLGQLYLNKGNWNDQQLIDTSYINWSLQPHPASPDYGSHVWLNTTQKEFPSAPASMYWFSGYEGQYVFVIPQENLIVVRLGLSKGPPFNMDEVLREILECI